MEAGIMKNRILLIEDNEETANMVKDYLAGEGFEVCSFRDGKTVMESALDFGQYALALIDLMLPDMNGFEIIKNVRKLSTVPIIIITARDGDADKAL